MEKFLIRFMKNFFMCILMIFCACLVPLSMFGLAMLTLQVEILYGSTIALIFALCAIGMILSLLVTIIVPE